MATKIKRPGVYISIENTGKEASLFSGATGGGGDAPTPSDVRYLKDSGGVLLKTNDGLLLTAE